MMIKLVLFDIDGTLVNSNTVDAICYVRSLVEEFGLTEIDERWETYRSATDSGILDEIFERAFSRCPSEEEVERHIRRFLRLLEDHHSEDQDQFREIEGAGDIIKNLKDNSEWRVGIATGAWRESALFKLESAGIHFDGIPLATCSEAKSREAILQRCIDSCRKHYGTGEFDKIVSVGDAVWDVKTARTLNLGFVGINLPQRIAHTTDYNGVKDYREQKRFMDYLEDAKVPDIQDH